MLEKGLQARKVEKIEKSKSAERNLTRKGTIHTKKGVQQPSKKREQKKQQGGNDDSLENMLAGPIAMVWVPMIQLKQNIFQRRIVTVSQDIVSIIIKGCVLNCKKTRNAQSFEEFRAIMSVFDSFDVVQPSLLDNDIFIGMLVQFLQAIFFPIGKITSDLMQAEVVAKFIDIINKKTRPNYVANYCLDREMIEIEGRIASEKYTCGRAISQIPYLTYKEGLPRILIHRTMHAMNDEQDFNDVLDYMNRIINSGGMAKRIRKTIKKVT
jgi:hypothetical protein